jgi:predicted DNA-binding transcriptional regulator AlpA
MSQQLISKNRVAALLAVHPQTIARWIRKGEFPPGLRAAGRNTALRWRVAEVEGWIAARAADRQLKSESIQ